MIDFNDLQKPLIAVLALGAAAAAGFAAGYLVGRDPETGRRLAKSAASGMLRARVAAAEAMENLGDLWADARAEALRDIEDEHAGTSRATVVAADSAAPAAAGVTRNKRSKAATTPRVKQARRGAKRTPLAAAANVT
jgi:hypothetical protein